MQEQNAQKRGPARPELALAPSFTIDNNVLHTSEGRRILSDWGAISKMGQLMAKKTKKQGILDLWMMLDRCSQPHCRVMTSGMVTTLEIGWSPGGVPMQLHWIV
jgi:hypothetical protein